MKLEKRTLFITHEHDVKGDNLIYIHCYTLSEKGSPSYDCVLERRMEVRGGEVMNQKEFIDLRIGVEASKLHVAVHSAMRATLAQLLAKEETA